MKAGNPGLYFSGIQVNYNYSAKRHVDKNNIGPNVVPPECICILWKFSKNFAFYGC